MIRCGAGPPHDSNDDRYKTRKADHGGQGDPAEAEDIRIKNVRVIAAAADHQQITKSDKQQADDQYLVVLFFKCRFH